MMDRRKILSIISLMVVTVVVICGIWLLFSSRPTNTVHGNITDRDTGEVYDIDVNNFETGGSGDEATTAGSAVLFGIEDFMKKSEHLGLAETSFATDVRDAIRKYSQVRLQGSYDTVTLRPQNLSLTSDSLDGQLRLGQGDDFASIHADIHGNGKAALITIKQDGKKDFFYVGYLSHIDQTLYTISQKSYDTPEVTIESYTYREAALQALQDIGFSIPDLDVKFTNHRNPFL